MKHLTKSIPSMVFIFSTLLLTSCNTEELASPDLIIEKPVSDKGNSYESLGYKSMDDMLNHGWKIIQRSNVPNNKLSKSLASKEGENTTTKQELSREVLKSVGIDPTSDDAVFLPYKYLYGGFGYILPGGLSLSRTSFCGNGSSYNLSKLFDIYAYLETTPIATMGQPVTKPDVLLSVTIYNGSDEETLTTPSIQTKTGYKTTWSKQVSGSLKVAAKSTFKLPLIGDTEISVEVTVGGSTTDGTESSNETDFKVQQKVKVPPHSQKTVTIAMKRVEATGTYKIDYAFTGEVGVNYSEPVGDHYFHKDAASKLAPSLASEKGSLSASVNYNATVVESPATAYTGTKVGS